MTIYVFGGPTLTQEDIETELDAVCRPPVREGDVYRAVENGAAAIGIIDGAYAGVPRVAHTEILWAISRGVHVYGAAGMGALRAAELADHGMIGVGAVFNAFRRDQLQDDDEVFLVHEPEEDGYRHRSEALVNIRATLQRAARLSVIALSTYRRLQAIAKGLLYPDRSYPRILGVGRETGLPSTELEVLAEWIPASRVDAMRQDALAMLRRMRRDIISGGPRPMAATFQPTASWNALVREAQSRSVPGSAAPGSAASGGTPEGQDTERGRLLEELRLDPAGYRKARRAALGRHLALSQGGARPEADAIARATEELRRAKSLRTDHDLDLWLDDNQLSPEGFGALMVADATCNRAEALARGAIGEHLLDHLRSTGDYVGLRARAERKRVVLSLARMDDPRLDEMGETVESLVEWWFDRTGELIPTDLDTYARSIDLDGAEELIQSLLRERAYDRLTMRGD